MANRADWDAYADEYQSTHGEYLGDAGFLWGPEGVREDDLGALGDVPARTCSRSAAAQGSARAGCAAAAAGRSASTSPTGSCNTAGGSTRSTGSSYRPSWPRQRSLPFGDRTFDIVFSAFGALQFVADAPALVADVARVLRPGGVFAFSITHPTRWMFLDDPGEEGLVASAVLLGPHAVRRGGQRHR